MPVIGHISNGASSERAISYGFGKNRHMKNNTEQWLADNGVKVDFSYIGYSSNSRAVWVGGTNGIDGYHASDDMAFNQKIHNQTKKKNQVMCIVQSFGHDELDPLNPADWEKANLLGREFAKKAYPEYECAVFTQIDNKNHLIHNHVYVDKVNLITGHKLKEPRRLNDFYAINDEISREQGWKVIPPKREHKLNAENKKKKTGRKAFVSYVKETVDSLMTNDEITSKTDFIKALDEANIIYDDKNKLNRFISKIEKDKSGKAFVVRGKRLGTDYEKEAINNELELRSRKQTTKSREQELTIEKQAITSDLRQSSNEFVQSEADKRTAESDQQDAQNEQSIIAEIAGSIERKADELRKRLERLRAKIRAKIIPQGLLKQTSNVDKQQAIQNFEKATLADQKEGTLSFSKLTLTTPQARNLARYSPSVLHNELNNTDTLYINQQPTLRRHTVGTGAYELLSKKYAMPQYNPLIKDFLKSYPSGNYSKIQFNIPVSSSLINFFKTQQNPEVRKGFDIDKKLKEGQYSYAKLANGYRIFDQNNQEVSLGYKKHEQTPTRRTSHRRIQIKKNQNKNKNIDRGPKM